VCNNWLCNTSGYNCNFLFLQLYPAMFDFVVPTVQGAAIGGSADASRARLVTLYYSVINQWNDASWELASGMV
jgi:hypothetical protein